MSRIIRIAGVSGSGKTSLIQQLLQEFQWRGIATACLKHSHHELDLPSKDSTVLFKASSQGAMVIGKNAVSVTLPLQHKTPQAWADFLFPNAQIILVEGWREFELPSILLSADLPPDWTIPKNIIATYGKHRLLNIPNYADAKALAPFLLQQLKLAHISKLSE